MDPERALALAKAHRDDLLREAEADRLLRSYSQDQDASAMTPDPLLARIGDLLVATGTRLQARRAPQAPQLALAPLLASSTAPLFSLHYFHYASGRAATYMFWYADATSEAHTGAGELRGTLAWQSLS